MSGNHPYRLPVAMPTGARPLSHNRVRGAHVWTAPRHALPPVPPSATARLQTFAHLRSLAPASRAPHTTLGSSQLNITVVKNTSSSKSASNLQQQRKANHSSYLGAQLLKASNGPSSIRPAPDVTSGLSKLLHAASTGEVTITKVVPSGTFVPQKGKPVVAERPKVPHVPLRNTSVQRPEPGIAVQRRRSIAQAHPRREMHAVPRSVAQAMPKVIESAVVAEANRTQNNCKNLAVVHPQVRTSAHTVGEAAQAASKATDPVVAPAFKNAQPPSTTRLQSEQDSGRPLTSGRPDPYLPKRPPESRPNVERTVTAQQTQTNVTNIQKQAFLVDIANELRATAQKPADNCDASTGQTPLPPKLVCSTDNPVQCDSGSLQVPSGLKVDFINLDDLLIGDLHYLAEHFGKNILEPLSMDDIAKKGFSEWIDVTDPAEIQRILSELETTKEDSATWIRWSPGADTAYPIVVPDDEDCSRQQQMTPPPESRPCEPKQPRSPLILIIKKGGVNGSSSSPWQLSSREKAAGDKGMSKSLFLNALNLYPNTEEVAKKLRKGRSARSLAVLKDRVMSDYLKNFSVPLHRVQGMYRYLFKKGHLREGKMTYACEVYRNLRSREGRKVTSAVKDAADRNLGGTGQLSPSKGLLRHLPTKKTTSNTSYFSDTVYRRVYGSIHKSHRNIWRNPRGPHRTTSALSCKIGRAEVPWTPPFHVVDGNWMADDLEVPSKWGLWVSENTQENKMGYPVPVVLLHRVGSTGDQCKDPLAGPPCELYCKQCCYSCLNKTSMMLHFAKKHQGIETAYMSVPLNKPPTQEKERQPMSEGGGT
ncbi:uncharacterized protein LOC135385333 [Ornithodoros turicata]|uniref:uncharacterized protein LOC135385333 n=1 Tax=Ornithodoros turicata TaxID=34597 RepID=UPI003139E7F5